MAEDKTQKELESAKKGSGMLIMIILSSVALLGGGGFFVWKKFLSTPSETESVEKKDIDKKDSTTEPKKEDGKNKDSKSTVEANIYTLPDIIVNLRPIHNQSSILKVKLKIELAKVADAEAIKVYEAALTDQVISFLREQTIKDVEGSSLERIRQELYQRVRTTIPNFEIVRILFKEFITQ